MNITAVCGQQTAQIGYPERTLILLQEYRFRQRPEAVSINYQNRKDSK